MPSKGKGAEKGLFAGKTAWFAPGTPASVLELWEAEGGGLSSVDDAVVLFSDDNTDPTTMELLASTDPPLVYRTDVIPEMIRNVNVRVAKYLLVPQAALEEMEPVGMSLPEPVPEVQKKKAAPAATAATSRQPLAQADVAVLSSSLKLDSLPHVRDLGAKPLSKFEDAAFYIDGRIVADVAYSLSFSK